MKKLLTVIAMIFAGMQAAHAENVYKPKPFEFERMYFGAGLTYNQILETFRYSGVSIDYDPSIGFQALIGYDLGMQINKMRVLVEGGYHDTGEFQGEVTIGGNKFEFTKRYQGPWAAAIASYEFLPRFDGQLRLGYDAGDAKGPLFGIGANYWLIRNLGLQANIVRRSEYNSVQFNVLFRP